MCTQVFRTTADFWVQAYCWRKLPYSDWTRQYEFSELMGINKQEENNSMQNFITDLKSLLKQSFQANEKFWNSIKWKISFGGYNDCQDIYRHQKTTLALACSLADEGNNREAFILLRTSFEYLLYFKLMCEADHFFTLWHADKPFSRKEALENARNQIAAGNGDAIRAEEFNLAGNDNRYFRVIFQNRKMARYYYWNAFVSFDPIECFLSSEEYSNHFHLSEDEDLRKEIEDRANERQKGASETRRSYLTLQAIMDSLKLSSLLTNEEQRRIEAHYTFLSSFAHPSKKGYRSYHLRDDKDIAHLMVFLYAAFISAEYNTSLKKLIELDSEGYIESFDASSVDDFQSNLEKRHGYFWFLFNQPSKFDKYDSWVKSNPKQVDNPELLSYESIKFPQDVFKRLQGVFKGWSTRYEPYGENKNIVRYEPPSLENLNG